MKRQEVLQILTGHKDELQDRFGVRSLSLFGSMARDEATETSDVDVLVEFARPTGYFGLIALQERLESLLHCRVDIGTLRSLKPRLRQRILGECIHVA
jgi:uncharacterized protein